LVKGLLAFGKSFFLLFSQALPQASAKEDEITDQIGFFLFPVKLLAGYSIPEERVCANPSF
jgi:hypothetical protein